MNKAQVIYSFWSQFAYPAYDENTVPIGDDAPRFPYVTYNYKSGEFGDNGNSFALSGSLWDRSTSWARMEELARQIAITIRDSRPIECEDGYVWIRQGTPFMERMGDPTDDMIRRIRINLDVKFITTY